MKGIGRSLLALLCLGFVIFLAPAQTRGLSCGPRAILHADLIDATVAGERVEAEGLVRVELVSEDAILLSTHDRGDVGAAGRFERLTSDGGS